MSKKNTFIVKIDNKDVTLKIMTLTPEIRSESQLIYSDAFNKAVSGNLLLRIEAEKLLQTRGLLNNDDNQKKIENLRKQLKEQEIILRKGLIDSRRMTKDEGKSIALNIKKIRSEIASVGTEASNLLNNTIEAVSENERLQYFIYACTVFADNGNRFWPSFDAFKSESNGEILEKATRIFLTNVSGIDQDYEKGLYENQWLIKMGFMNEKMQLINEKGQLVDEDGRLINSEGRFINDNGDFVDAFGNLVDKDGNLLEADSWGVDVANTGQSTGPETPQS